MEVDGMHTTIERKLTGVNVNEPADYITICKSARRVPKPYNVLYLSHKFFKKKFSKFSNINTPWKKGW